MKMNDTICIVGSFIEDKRIIRGICQSWRESLIQNDRDILEGFRLKYPALTIQGSILQALDLGDISLLKSYIEEFSGRKPIALRGIVSIIRHKSIAKILLSWIVDDTKCKISLAAKFDIQCRKSMVDTIQGWIDTLSIWGTIYSRNTIINLGRQILSYGYTPNISPSITDQVYLNVDISISKYIDMELHKQDIDMKLIESIRSDIVHSGYKSYNEVSLFLLFLRAGSTKCALHTLNKKQTGMRDMKDLYHCIEKAPLNDTVIIVIKEILKHIEGAEIDDIIWHKYFRDILYMNDILYQMIPYIENVKVRNMVIGIAAAHDANLIIHRYIDKHNINDILFFVREFMQLNGCSNIKSIQDEIKKMLNL